jgi:ParB family chromosome partitioning protein
MTTRRIDEIVVGERHRRDLGDIASLAANVAELGRLHPIVIRPDGMLIAGERRLLAAKQLIPVNVMDHDAVCRGEYADDQNARRGNLGREKAPSVTVRNHQHKPSPADSIQVGTRHRRDLGGALAPDVLSSSADVEAFVEAHVRSRTDGAPFLPTGSAACMVSQPREREAEAGKTK